MYHTTGACPIIGALPDTWLFSDGIQDLALSSTKCQIVPQYKKKKDKEKKEGKSKNMEKITSEFGSTPPPPKKKKKKKKKRKKGGAVA